MTDRSGQHVARRRRRRAPWLAQALASVFLPVAAFAQVSPSEALSEPASEPRPSAWPAQPTAPRGAPNVLVILTDDVGFGVTSPFGGPVPTTAFAALAREGLRYNRFNTTALCSPTRASLLTGRMPHNVNMGNVTNLPTAYDGYTSVIPDTAATVAQVLRAGGYNTAMFGKGHVTPEWEMSLAGPYDRWPTGLGFEYFYGFLSADTSMWNPGIVENTRPVEPPHDDPDYFFEKDMADKAIAWMREQNAVAPDKPFFLYYAPGIAHTPHHAPKAWLERFRGQFDQGWDRLRAEIFARQKAMGVIPADSALSPRPEALPAWDSLGPAQKRVYARLMEAYAASVAYSDHQTGRLIEAIRETGEFDNTLVIYIEGDNGSSAEGGLNGLAFEQSTITGRKETFAELERRIDEIGGPNLYNHFPAAWAWALNAPFPWWKQIASQAGGVRNGMVVSWPARIRDAGAVRSQYAHVSDIMPTVLEAAGIAAPATFRGVAQQPVDGISFAYSFAQADAPSRRRTQLYEMMENFGIYHDGWAAGTLPKRMAWEVGVGENRRSDVGPRDRTWTLFDLEHDFTTAHDLARSNPGRLKELQDLFWVQAAQNHVLPIHDWAQGRAGRPTLGGERTTFVYRPGLTRIAEDAAPHTIGHSFRIDARIAVPQGGASGVLLTQGGRFGGYGFYLVEGRPVFHYNAVGDDQFTVRAGAALAPGAHRVSATFAADAPRPGTAGTLTIAVDGKAVASGRIGRTVAGWMSHTEGLDVGRDTITPVSGDYTVAGSAFTGTIETVTVTIGPEPD